MNIYVLKGCLVSIGKDKEDEVLKNKVFDSISYRGFINSTYDIIGVELGLGVMYINNPSRPEDDYSVKIQIWNINQKKNFAFSNTHYLNGSRFVLVCWREEFDPNMEELEKTLKECINLVPDSRLGIIAIKDNKTSEQEDRISRTDINDDDLVKKKISDVLNMNLTIVNDLEELMKNLVISHVERVDGNFILKAKNIENLEQVESIENPLVNVFKKECSENLKEFLTINGMNVEEDNSITIEKDKHIYKIDLKSCKVRALSKECKSCAYYPKSRCFKNICIVLDRPNAYGYASEEIGFNKADLFILSIIYSITSGILPSTVTSQLPSRKPKCLKKAR
ncbi:MAG: hypothetical protein ACTSVI_13285 [Promethearchaeota archaeon]